METVSGPDFPSAEELPWAQPITVSVVRNTAHLLCLMDHFQLITVSSCQETMNFHYEVWCKPLSREQHFQMFNAYPVLTPEYFSRISLSLYLHPSFVVSFANSTRISRLVSRLDTKATGIAFRVQSLMRCIRPGYQVIQKQLGVTARSHQLWDTVPQSTVYLPAGGCSRGTHVQGLSREQMCKCIVITSFLPRDGIWFHIPRSFLTLSKG